MDEFSDGTTIFAPKNNNGTIKREWVGLTDEEWFDIHTMVDYRAQESLGSYADAFGEILESKLKEKNT